MSDTTDLNVVESADTSDSFVKELAKIASTNAAATAGTLAGLVVAFTAVEQIQKYVRTRAEKKAVDTNVTSEA